MVNKVQVLTIKPHIERQRRDRDDRYYVKPERVDYLVKQGWVQVASEAEAEAEAQQEAEQRAELEARAEKDAQLNAKSLDELLEEWKPRQSPERYLARWPEGPHSAEARVILAKLAETV